MSLYVLDTDHVTLHQRNHPQVIAKLQTCVPEEVSVTVITLEEQMRGRLAQLRRPGYDLTLVYDQLIATAKYFCGLIILPFDAAAQQQFR